MTDIVIDRDNIVKLDQAEQDLLDEIEIHDEVPIKSHRSPPRPKHNAMPVHPEPTQPVDMDAFTNPNKMTAPPPPQPDIIDYGDAEEEDDTGGMDFPQSYAQEEEPSEGYNSIDDEKAELLNKLSRLEKKGIAINKRINAYSSISEIRTEYKRASYSIEVDQSVRVARRMMIATVTGLEFVNKKYNPVDVYLDGWSESVMENIDDYDEVFEDLYVKYKDKVNVAPEVKLMMMLGGSAVMYHLTNSMFKKAFTAPIETPVPQMPQMHQMPQMTPAPPPPPFNSQTGQSDRPEMKGPNMDISSLMKGVQMPNLQPMSTTNIPPPTVPEDPIMEQQAIEDDIDDLSDIVSISGESTGGEVKEVSIKKSRGRKRSSKNEISL